MVDLTYSPHVETEELPGRPYPRLPESVPEGVFGGEIGHAIEGAGSIAEQHFNQIQDQARQTQLTDAHNQLQTLSLQLTHDPNTGAFTKQGKNAFGLNQQYLPQFDTQAAQIIGNVPDPKARQAAQLAAGQVRNHLSEQLDSHELSQHAEYNANTAKASVGIAQQTAAANYNHPDIIATNLDHVDASLENLSKQQGWSPEALEEAKYNAHVQLHEGVLTNQLADNQIGMAKAYLDSVRHELKPAEIKQAETAIKGGEVKATADPIAAAYAASTSSGEAALAKLPQSGLDQEQQAKVVQQVEQQRSALTYQRAQQYDKQLTALHTALASGNLPADWRSQTDMLYSRGALNQEQHISMLDTGVRAEKKDTADDEAFSYANDAFQKGTPLDPKSKGDTGSVGVLFDRMTKGQAPGSPSYVNTAESIAAKTGVVPASAVSFARANLVSGEPQAAAQSAEMLDRLQRINPRAYSYAVSDPETKAMAHTISVATQAGTDPVTAVTMARENAERSKSQQTMLDAQWNKQFPSGPGSQARRETMDDAAIQAGLKDDPAYRGPGAFFRADVPTPPTAMAAEFNDLTREYFNHTGGNLAQAHQLALNDLKSTWGVSEVNGQRELMKYAPERMVPGLTADEVKTDIAASGHPAARIAESAETGPSGGKVWNLTAKDEFGAYDVVRDKNGLPMRYQLPDPKESAVAAAKKQQVEDQAKLIETQRKNQMVHEGEAAIGRVGF